MPSSHLLPCRPLLLLPPASPSIRVLQVLISRLFYESETVLAQCQQCAPSVPVSQFVPLPFPLRCPFVCSFYLCFANRIIYTIFSYFEHCVFVKFLFCFISIAWCPELTIRGAARENWKSDHLRVLGTVGKLGRAPPPGLPHPLQHLLHSTFLSLEPLFNSIFVPRGPYSFIKNIMIIMLV